MNRAICLQRPEPTADDIELTGKIIVDPGAPPGPASSAAGLSPTTWPWLAPLAQAYHEVYTSQTDRDFFGMRDYYSLIKLLRLQLKNRAFPHSYFPLPRRIFDLINGWTAHRRPGADAGPAQRGPAAQL